MLVCTKEDFRKICNMTKDGNISKGNYWFITRSGKNYTVHADIVEGNMVFARIIKEEKLKGLINGYIQRIKLTLFREAIYKIKDDTL